MTNMFQFIIFSILISLSKANGNPLCEIYNKFSLKEVVGSWYAVAIVPENGTEQKKLTCCQVDFSECDQTGFQWLMNKTLHNQSSTDLGKETKNIEIGKGVIIRQRYHSIPPYDVWSQSLENLNGCFKQLLSLDSNKLVLDKVISQNATMQLSLLDTSDGSGQFLVQRVWGKAISAVIYHKNKKVTEEQIKPVFKVMKTENQSNFHMCNLA